MTLDESPTTAVVARPRSHSEPLAPLPSGHGPRRRTRRESEPPSPWTITTRYRLALVREPVGPYVGYAAGPDEEPPITRPAEAARFLWRYVFHDEPREVVAVVFINARNRATGHMVAFTGTLERTSAEPRHILAGALAAYASGILVAHNHPSGDPTPSTEDLIFTNRMQAACDVLGVRLVDFLVLGGADRWRSTMKKAVW
jgi:proteasome lid subunit RPN8/RPN11